MSNEVKTGGEENVSILGQLLAEEAASGTEAKATPEVAELQRALAYEKQRNDSLQGRVDSQLRPLNQTVRELQQQLNQVRANPTRVEVPATEVSTVTVQDLLAELSPADRELMGEKQLNILARLIEKPTLAMVDKVRNELQASFDAKFDTRLRQMEGQIAGQTGRELWDRVDQMSPGARDRNDVDDPQWVEFLNQKDPISGRMRKDLGNAAVDAGDVARLALLHDEFLKLTGQPKPERTGDGGNRELRPEGSRAEPGVSSSTLPTLKNSEIETFYKDLASGKYEAKPQLAEKMEALITAAIQDGRVV
jgi:hypothetical protein